MKNEDKVAQQLSSIQAELVTLFGDFCRRSPAPGIESLLQEFQQHRLNLVFTVTASADETGLFCGFISAGAAPADMQTLFTIHSHTAPADYRGLH